MYNFRMFYKVIVNKLHRKKVVGRCCFPKRPHVTQKLNKRGCLCQQTFYRNKLPKKYSSHLRQNEILLGNHIQRNCTRLCTESTLRDLCDKWMGLPTNVFLSTDHLPTTYQPLTDHLPTTYRPPTDQPPTDHLPTIYRPLTDHLPTTYRPPTYRPPTDHLPTTYRPLF